MKKDAKDKGGAAKKKVAEKKSAEKKPVAKKVAEKKSAEKKASVQKAAEGKKPVAKRPAAAAKAKPAAKKPAAAAKPAAAKAKPAAKKPAAAAKPAAPKSAPKKPPAAKPRAAKPRAAKPAAVKPAIKEAAKQIVFDTSEDRSVVADQAVGDPVILTALIENLSGSQRRVRQFSAAAVNQIANQDPEILLVFIDDISDALHRPEAQTRWECLEALSSLVLHDAPACEQALHGAEISLYDEDSGSARLAALRFLCAYGALDSRRAQKVWPLVEEAIQCYHGDPEYQDMLISVTQFAHGRIGKVVKEALATRVDFDAKNSKGSLGRRAREIVELCGK